MKHLKFLTIACLSFIAVSISKPAQAQTYGNAYTFASGTNASGLDTVVNTATKTQTLTLAGYWDVVTVQCTITKISGTVGGTLSLLGSLDGVTYKLIGSAQTPSDGTAAYIFSVNPSLYGYYKITYLGATTQSASIKSIAISRRANPQQRQF